MFRPFGAPATSGRLNYVNLFIEVLDGELKGTRIPAQAGLTFGRHGCDLNIQDSKVSSKHAEIQEGPNGRLWLMDQGSVNGIKVKKERFAELPLEPGLIFRLGQTRFSVGDMAAAEAASAEWFGTLKTLAEAGITKKHGKPKPIQIFPTPVRLQFTRGLQIGVEWHLGYGPREIGASSVELPIFEPKAPAKCFQLVAENERVVLKVHEDAKGKVLLNGRFVETANVKPGDMVDIGSTRIEIRLEEK